MTINGRIVLLRQRLGLSQRVFGERISRSVGYISKVEAGKIEPSEDVIDSICTAFGVDKTWLKSGIGVLNIESIGNRVKLVRRSRDYTQEELAQELHISRNSVGMIERGTFRPGDEIVDAICDKLWIDKNWLLTGVGSMERTELTPFYELLKHDAAVRQHIRTFIDHLDHLDRTSHSSRVVEESVPEPDRWVTAYVVNDVEAARLFFKHYNIAYREEPEEQSDKQTDEGCVAYNGFTENRKKNSR